MSISPVRSLGCRSRIAAISATMASHRPLAERLKAHRDKPHYSPPKTTKRLFIVASGGGCGSDVRIGPPAACAWPYPVADLRDVIAVLAGVLTGGEPLVDHLLTQRRAGR